MPGDRSTDRHRLISLSRLRDADTDAWLRDYARQTSQSVMKVVTAAVKHYRTMIENGEDPK